MSSPQPISGIIPQVIARLGLAQRMKEAEILSAWKETAGTDIAEHTHPEGIYKAVLRVNVDSSPWLNELKRYSGNIILQKLQDRFGKKAVKDIRFRIGTTAGRYTTGT